MEFIRYISRLEAIMSENYPNKETRTVEDYLKVISTMCPGPSRVPRKSLDVAEKCRTKGNNCFYMHEYDEAVLHYTASLKAAPPCSTSSALAYANRSAALCHLGAWKECIADIERALNLPYPEGLKPKIIKRRESAVAKLNGANGESGAAATENLKYVHGENAKLPGVGNGVEIARDAEGKRGLVATKAFQLGDVLLIEDAYLAVASLDASQKFCHHCLKMSLCLILCNRCCISVYCSESCREKAYEKYHRLECVLLEILDSVKFVNMDAILFVVRCLIVFTEQGNNLEALYRDFEEIENNPDPTNIIFTDEQFAENKRKPILSLRTKYPKELNWAALIEVAYVVTLLRNYTDFFQSHADIPRVANILVKMYKILSSNDFKRLYSKRKEIKAYSLYPLTSLANHTCINNTIVYIDHDERLVLRASKNIKPGDQICYTYRSSTFMIENPMEKTSEIVHSQRHCSKCDKTVCFPTQRRTIFKLQGELHDKLSNKFDDVDSLWKLLKLMYEKDQGYTIQAQLTKMFLIDAYEGCMDEMNSMLQFCLLGIF